MNPGLVEGKDCTLLGWFEDEWVPFACARSVSFDFVTDFMEVSITGSGKFRDFEPTANSFIGTLEGITNIYKPNNLTIAEVRDMQMNHTKILLRFQRQSRDLHYYTSEAYFYFSNSSDTWSFDNIGTFSVGIRGTGGITDIFTPSPVVGAITYSMYYESDGSFELSFQDNLLIGVTVIGAWRQTDYTVITTGTVLINEIKHDASTGIMSWVIPMEPDEVWHIQFKA